MPLRLRKLRRRAMSAEEAAPISVGPTAPATKRKAGTRSTKTTAGKTSGKAAGAETKTGAAKGATRTRATKKAVAEDGQDS